MRDVRLEVGRQLGFDLLPPDFIFLRGIGRNFARVRPKQEKQMKAKSFVPPLAEEPEMYLLEDPDGDRFRSHGTEKSQVGHPIHLSSPSAQDTESSLTSSEPIMTDNSVKRSQRKKDTATPTAIEGHVGIQDKRKSKIPRPSWTQKFRAVQTDDGGATALVEGQALTANAPGSGKRLVRRKRSAKSAKGLGRRGSRSKKRPASGLRKSSARGTAGGSARSSARNSARGSSARGSAKSLRRPKSVDQEEEEHERSEESESLVVRDLEIKEISGGKSKTLSTVSGLRTGQSISIHLKEDVDDEQDGKKMRRFRRSKKRSRVVPVDDLALWWLHPPPDGFAGGVRFNPSGHHLPRILRTLRLRRRQAEIIREDLRHYVHFLRRKTSQSPTGIAEDLWKRKLLEEKRDTQLLRDHLIRLDKDLRSARASSNSPNRPPAPLRNGDHPPVPSNQSNYKLSVMRLVNEIEDISRRVAATKARLNAEMQVIIMYLNI